MEPYSVSFLGNFQQDKLVILLTAPFPSKPEAMDKTIMIFKVEPTSLRFVRSFSLYDENEDKLTLPSLAGKTFVDIVLTGEYIFALEEVGMVRIQ